MVQNICLKDFLLVLKLVKSFKKTSSKCHLIEVPVGELKNMPGSGSSL